MNLYRTGKQLWEKTCQSKQIVSSVLSLNTGHYQRTSTRGRRFHFLNKSSSETGTLSDSPSIFELWKFQYISVDRLCIITDCGGCIVQYDHHVVEISNLHRRDERILVWHCRFRFNPSLLGCVFGLGLASLSCCSWFYNILGGKTILKLGIHTNRRRNFGTGRKWSSRSKSTWTSSNST